MSNSDVEHRKARQRAATQRGRRLEYRIKELLPGAMMETGQAGDVLYAPYRIEAKHRYDFKGIKTLGKWELQALDNVKRANQPGEIPAIAFSGGKARAGRIWVAIPIDEFRRLSERERLLNDLQTLREGLKSITDELSKTEST